MVKVTGKSLESLYRYIAGEIGGKAPASHEHTQAQVTGLTDVLNGKAAAKHGHEQADVAGLTVALDKKVDSEAPFLSSTLRDARITTGNQQVANVGPEGDNIYLGNPATQLWLESAHDINANIAGDVKKLYREGDGVPCRQISQTFTISPTDGWTYIASEGKYIHLYDVPGAENGMKVYVDTGTFCGTAFPIIGACPYLNAVEIAMADIPTISVQTKIDLFKVV